MSVESEIARRRRNLSSSVLQFPEDLGAHAVLFQFKKYDFRKPGTRDLNRLDSNVVSRANAAGADSIILPLPMQLRDNYSVSIRDTDLDFEGETVAGLAHGMGTMSELSFDALKSALSEALPDTTGSNSYMNNHSMVTALRFLGRRSLDGIVPGAGRALDVGLGNTINPKVALYFNGVDLKKHNFSWQFAPRNERESDLLRDLGRNIKRNILPTYGSVGPVARMLLNYPSTVDIFFFGVDQSYFMYYKTCMVSEFNIDFTPNGVALLRGGKPAAVAMSMSVMETDIHTAENYGGTSSYINITEDRR